MARPASNWALTPPAFHQLRPPTFALGVIAGDPRSSNPWFSAWLPGPDDGKVSVESTKVDGMTDFRVVHRTHTWIMCGKEVIAEVCRFSRRAISLMLNRQGSCACAA